MRSERREKHLPPPTTRADVGDVAQQGAADFVRQRVQLDAVALGPTHAHERLLPVQIVEGESRHFADAQSVRGKQQQRGAAPNVGRPVRVLARDEGLHIRPRRPRRQGFLLEESRPRNRGGDTRTTVLPVFGVAKEDRKSTRLNSSH